MNALTRVSESHVLHAQFAGPIVMIGFGSIGRGVLPLLERHIGFDRSKFVVLDPVDTDRVLLDERGLRFEKICDGRVWRSLDGEIRLSPVNDATTRVQIAMEGSTRALVPEFTIRAPMQSQLAQMTKALRERLERG